MTLPQFARWLGKYGLTEELKAIIAVNRKLREAAAKGFGIAVCGLCGEEVKDKNPGSIPWRMSSEIFPNSISFLSCDRHANAEVLAERERMKEVIRNIFFKCDSGSDPQTGSYHVAIAEDEDDADAAAKAEYYRRKLGIYYVAVKLKSGTWQLFDERGETMQKFHLTGAEKEQLQKNMEAAGQA